MLPLIHFVHGKESGPWGRKITYLSQIARQHGFDVESLDYSGIVNPMERVEKLKNACAVRPPDILVGSSMGGWVATTTTATVNVRGLFLMAPAFYLLDYPAHQTHRHGNRIEVVHGWRDGVIPYQNSVRFGEEHRCTVHLVDDDHRLANSLEPLNQYFTAFIQRVMVVVCTD